MGKHLVLSKPAAIKILGINMKQQNWVKTQIERKISRFAKLLAFKNIETFPRRWLLPLKHQHLPTITAH